MASSDSQPFNIDVVAIDSIVQSQNQLSYKQQRDIEKHHQHKDIIDLLFWNNRNDQFKNSTDSSFSITVHSVSDDDFNRLKYFIRSVLWPIDHPIRQQLWMNISTLNRVDLFKQKTNGRPSSQTGTSTLSTIIDNNFTSFGSRSLRWPKFVDTNNLCFYHLTEPKGRLLLQEIIVTFALHHPDITYCPTLEPICALLLHYNNENEVLYMINHLFIKNWFCGNTHLQWDAHCNVLKKLLRVYYKSAADVIDLRYANAKIFYEEWFWWIFRYLPFTYLVKILDCFLLEGPKLLFRISLALVHLFTKKLKYEPNGNIQNMNEYCQQIPVSLDRLLHIAFRIRNLKRRSIEQLIEQEEKLLRDNRYQSPIDHHSPSIVSEHLTQIPEKSILNHQQFLTLWNWLPVRLSLSQPILVFTTEEHGFRLQTLLNKIDELEYSILIIKTTNGEIFGGFCAGLWSDRHNRTYFGFGESFLFTLVPKQIKYAWVGQQSNRQNQTKCEMFLFVNHEKLIIGGGNGDGLCIDQSLCEGRTAHCETFDNQPLCSQTDFSIAVLEMITFDFSSS